MPGITAHLDAALDKLAQAPMAKRTLTEFRYVSKAISNRVEGHPGKPTGDGTYAHTKRQETLLEAIGAIQDSLEPFILQNSITAFEAIAQTLNQLLELASLEEFVLAEEFLEDLAEIERLVEEAQALGWDVQSLQTQLLVLFDLDAAPRSSWEYRERQREIRVAIFQAYSYAMRTQTLIRTAIRIVARIGRILEQVAGAIGNLTVSQGLGQSQAQLQQLLVESNVQRAAFERAQSLEGVESGVLMQGLRNIHEEMMVDHPR